MSLIMLAVVIYGLLYILLSVPSVQTKVKETVIKETSALLGGKIDIRTLSIRPFSEVMLSGVSLTSPTGDRCASIGKVAAGIDLWSLLTDRRIVINYAEIIALDARLSQEKKGGPLNIQFLIDALAPRDKNKPPTAFDLRFRNIVVRKSKASFERRWLTDSEGNLQPLAEVSLDNLRLDLSIPTLRNDHFRFAVRNMECDLRPGVSIRKFTADITFQKDPGKSGKDRLSVTGLRLQLPNSSLSISDFSISPASPFPLNAEISGYLTPSDLSGAIPALQPFDNTWDLEIKAGVGSDTIKVDKLLLEDHGTDTYLALKGTLGNYNVPDSLEADGIELKSSISPELTSKILASLPVRNKKLSAGLKNAGRIGIDLDGALSMQENSEARLKLKTGCGALRIEADAYGVRSRKPLVSASIWADDLNIGRLLGIPELGPTTFNADADLRGFDANAEGELDLYADYIEAAGRRVTGIEAYGRKAGNDISMSLTTDDDAMMLLFHGDCHIEGEDSYIDADLEVGGVNPSHFGVKGKLADNDITGSVKLYAAGNNVDNVTGFLKVSDLEIESPDDRTLRLSNLSLTIDALSDASGEEEAQSEVERSWTFRRSVQLRSDWLDADISGDIYPSTVVEEAKAMIRSIFPALLADGKFTAFTPEGKNDFSYSLDIKGESAIFEYLNPPVRPLADIPVSGYINAPEGNAQFAFTTPHLQQGKNKLIRNVAFNAVLDSFLGLAKVTADALVPVKNGDMHATAEIYALHDKVNATVGINPTEENPLKGNVALEATFTRVPNPLMQKEELAVHVGILPSTVVMNETVWTLNAGEIDYSGKKVAVDNFLVSHGNQYVKINGTASESDSDALNVRLNEIDLDYIFSILNINYVTFGGMASGEITGSKLLTKQPQARTEWLNVRGLSYNGAMLGDGNLASEYDAGQQKVGIYGVIRDPLSRERRASINGAIWVTRDSLSFDFDANRLNVKLMKPFMSAFCSDLSGLGSGKCKLYGTFKDIDLIGSLRADTLSMKLDFTNTWYHAGGDSVYLRKGVIDIPPLRLYDDFGNSAEFSGSLKHRYFHDPVFNFRVKDARNLLCYDTNEKINPLWYGTIFGTGNVLVNGRPGLIDIDINMATDPGSKFYYVISDTEDVEQYSFLTFTDSRKKRLEAEASDTVPGYLHKFMKKRMEAEQLSSNVVLSIKGSVTNDALVTLVMDPRGGDKITATGQGALQMDYNMASNDLRMFGTYVLDEGNYNFTLQDIIIKNFNIKRGSVIKFDGDPMDANLDIAATYRVNTNLTDLDKSFATDKELNRTNVPVDALLMVRGPMTHPDITFDIELPSVSSDVERKVKSIVSTNDMINRQIIYLLALNRFYTPEYSSGDKGVSGAEWSSMASSTISSQLSNILSQMTDKLNVAPSFRSDRGDFTDMEFDLALSSRLLNNRLLINGNFGYRDRNTSNTQFVGDFDIEYLLNKSGNLRLKAYNHFNDQNYYLRSALTTQGVGVVYTKDFDHMFGWLRRKRSPVVSDTVPEKKDSVENKTEIMKQ